MRKSIRIIGLLALTVLIAILIIPYLIPLPGGTDPVALADPGGSFVTVNSVRVYTLQDGPADGPAVLLLHGLGGSTFSWRENITALAAAGYRVIAFDRPGFGLSDKPLELDYAHPAQADFAIDLMDVLGVERAVLIGHSAGGNVIAHMAVRHPTRVSGLVIVDGAIVGGTGGPVFLGPLISFPPLTRWIQVLAPAVVTPERFNSLLASAYGPGFTVTDEISAGYGRVLQTEGWQNGFVGLVRDAGRNRLDLDAVATISAPTLIVWGEADTWVPVSDGETLRDLIPGASWVAYPGVGHLPMEEVPETFNRDVIAFLDSLPRQGR